MVHTIADLHVIVLGAMLMLHYEHHGADQQAAGWVASCIYVHAHA